MFKKEKNKAQVPTNGPEEITLRFNREQVDFYVGGRPLGFMMKEVFLGLFNSENPGRAFEDPKADLSFKELCTMFRFTRKGLALDMAAKMGGLNLDGQELRRAYTEAMERYAINAGANSDRVKAEIKRQIQEADDQDEVLTTQPNILFQTPMQPVQPCIVTIDLVGLNKYLAGGGDLDKFIKDGDYDKGDFKSFMKKNQKYLDLIV